MTDQIEPLINPFRPGAGQRPPYLAGREKEKDDFKALLAQNPVIRNFMIIGLRGTGKTALLEELKPIALTSGWLWAGTGLSESASISEETIAIRILADLAILTSQLLSNKKPTTGFGEGVEETRLDFPFLENMYKSQPGLVTDKLRTTLEAIWNGLKTVPTVKGVVFAYDEAQFMNDQKGKGQYPLSVLLDVFQSLQTRGLPFVLLLAGLPNLRDKVIEARGFAERMFQVDKLENLSEEESIKAISVPIEKMKSQLNFDDASMKLIAERSGGYPYFIQFICRDTFDSFIAQISRGATKPSVPLVEIQAKLDAEFFEPKWNSATDKERILLALVATLPNIQDFSIKEIMDKQTALKIGDPIGDNYISQLLKQLSQKGLCFRTIRHGKYTLGVPMLGDYVKRTMPLI